MSDNGIIIKPHKIKLYISSQTRGCKNLSKGKIEVWRGKAISLLIAIGGGATVYPGTGYYRQNNGVLSSEKIWIVESFLDQISVEIRNQIISLCIWAKSFASQETVAIEIDGNFYLV